MKLFDQVTFFNENNGILHKGYKRLKKCNVMTTWRGLRVQIIDTKTENELSVAYKNELAKKMVTPLLHCCCLCKYLDWFEGFV